jgi:leucyl-tRNA synthetase
MSVTKSYSSTYSLNTVVSDLMALTKVVSDDGPFVLLQRAATMVLIQLLAPIAPATAEECWSRLGPSKSGVAESYGPSVFDRPFPKEDGTLGLLASETQTCAVQVNGKLKFTAEIPFPDERLKGKELETWIVGEIMGTEDGKRRLVGPMDVTRAKKVIVVRGGKTVNFVL